MSSLRNAVWPEPAPDGQYSMLLPVAGDGLAKVAAEPVRTVIGLELNKIVEFRGARAATGDRVGGLGVRARGKAGQGDRASGSQ